MKLAAIGDFHIPKRAVAIPEWILKMLKKENPDRILVTGDLTNIQVLEDLEKIAEVYAVTGNMDDLLLPETISISISGYSILVIHSHQVERGNLHALNKYVEPFAPDVVIFGHTHKALIQQVGDRLFVNPGTATGVWGGGTEGEPQSFAILDIKEKIDIRIYSRWPL